MKAKIPVKERIIFKALELFYIQGVHNTGINQIIDESGVAKASFYQYFPSKDDLILACIEIYTKQIKEQIGALIERSTGFKDFASNWASSIKDRLQGKGRSYNGCPIANLRFSMLGEKKYDDAFKTVIADWSHILQRYLLDLKNKGGLPKKTDTVLLAKRMIHIHEGAAIMWKLTGDDTYFDDLAKIAEHFV